MHTGAKQGMYIHNYNIHTITMNNYNSDFTVKIANTKYAIY